MNTFFQDEFFNKKIFNRLKNEVKKDQLDKTIEEIDYYNELQKHFLKRFGLDEDERQIIENNFENNTKNAARQSL